MKQAVLVLLVMLCVLVNTAFSQKPTVVTDNDPGWHKIGQITASFDLDNESIIVYGRDEFTKIRFKVTDAPINIDKVQVFYEEGGSEELAVESPLQAGEETRVLDLKGSNKEIEKVVFTYKTLPNSERERATVELYGFKVRQDKSDAFRDDNDNDADNDGDNDVEVDVDTDVDEEVREAGDEVGDETRETRDEIKEETREARDEMKEETREAREEMREERDEARDEYREEKREAKEEVKEADEEIDESAEKVGDDISEAAVNAASHIKDKVYVDKVGPKGQTVYIDKHDKFYYVNDEGKKVFVKKWELKDKPDND